MTWLVDVRFENSPLHGMGAFAGEFIPKGAKVWAIDPSMPILGPAELGGLSAEELHFALHGGYLHFPTQKFVYYDDGMQYVNHGEDGRENIGITRWTPLMEDHCAALRDIRPGEELLENYTFWSILHLRSDHWLIDMYRDFCPGQYDFLKSLEKRRQIA